MKELIEQRHLDVNDQDSEGFTILQYGALGGHDHIIKYLTSMSLYLRNMYVCVKIALL